MENVSPTRAAEQSHHKATAGHLAWSLAWISIAGAGAALGIAVRQAAASGDYQLLVTHQTLTPFITAGFAVLGALVASRRPRNPIGWIFVIVGLLFALVALAAAAVMVSEPDSQLYKWAVWLDSWLWIPAALLPVTFVPLVFPDGRLPSPVRRFVAWSAAFGLALVLLGVMFHPGQLDNLGREAANPFGIPAAKPVLDFMLALSTVFLAVGVFGSLAAFLVRFHRSRGIEREQIKWLVYALGICVLLSVLASLFAWLLPGFRYGLELSIVVTDLGILSIAIAAAIAILHYRLYDIDLIINRTLVYAALTAGVAALYVLIVGGLGALFQASNNVLLSLLAVVLTAVLFQPLRERLQRAINRLMYGERDDPYAVLSRLSRRLETSLSPEATLPAVVETVAETLKLPYVAIALKQDGGFKIAAAYGLAKGETIQVPLTYQGEIVGLFSLATRSPNEAFKPAEQRLIEDIARHIGIAAHAVRLTDDLRQLAADLQHSRERLITAREEERRRLRRNLHDGLGPVLAGQGLKLGALLQSVERDPAAARALINGLIAQNQDVMAEIRRLVYDLRPPALDELGLVGAIRDQVLLMGEKNNPQPRIQIHIQEPAGGLPPLPAGVEIAAYRITMEAMTNVYRHAGASACEISFSINHASRVRALHLEICDDGKGLPAQTRPGIGLVSMKERAEEVGGECVVEANYKGGTRVFARLPLFQ